MKNVRQLKISKKHMVSAAFRREVTTVPSLLIQGKWFERAGFFPGDIVDVIITQRSIQIVKQGQPL